jgi:hypothetical protein
MWYTLQKNTKHDTKKLFRDGKNTVHCQASIKQKTNPGKVSGVLPQVLGSQRAAALRPALKCIVEIAARLHTSHFEAAAAAAAAAAATAGQHPWRT